MANSLCVNWVPFLLLFKLSYYMATFFGRVSVMPCIFNLFFIFPYLTLINFIKNITSLTTLLITKYEIGKAKVCGNVDHNDAGYLSFLPPTLTQLTLPHNILSSSSPNFPLLLTSFQLGKSHEYLMEQIDPIL